VSGACSIRFCAEYVATRGHAMWSSHSGNVERGCGTPRRADLERDPRRSPVCRPGSTVCALAIGRRSACAFQLATGGWGHDPERDVRARRYGVGRGLQ